MSTAAAIAAPFRFEPFPHQLREFEEHCDTPARAWAWAMRAGKTKSAYDKASYLYTEGRLDGLLVFAPNGVHANWIETELPKHLWENVPFQAFIWRSTEFGAKHADHKQFRKEFRAACKTRDLIVLTVNTESMTRADVRPIIRYMLEHRFSVMVVFDESDDWGIPGSKRTKMSRALARHCTNRIIMSGTMLTGSPFAAYSQFELLDKNALGYKRYDDFKAHYGMFELTNGKGGRKFNKLVGFQNEDELRAKMAPYMSVVTREDANLPPLNIEVRKFELSPQQKAVYKNLKKSIFTEVDGEQVSIGALASKIQKLQQVTGGFVIDEYKKVHRIPGPNPRLELLLREVYLAPGKVIVWCEFQEELDQVVKALRLAKYGVAEYHGRVTDQAKATGLKSFRTNRAVKCLVGHCQSAGRGQDFSAAALVIWYSHTFKARFRAQALERATKYGGGNVHVLDFVGPGPDSYILDVTEGRARLNDYLAGDGMKKLQKELDI